MTEVEFVLRLDAARPHDLQQLDDLLERVGEDGLEHDVAAPREYFA